MVDNIMRWADLIIYMKIRFFLVAIIVIMACSCFATAYTGFRATPTENDPITYHFVLNGPEPDGTIVKSIVYDFGDNTKSTNSEVDHTYKKQGSYKVSCTITWSDEYGTEYITTTKAVIRPGLLTHFTVNFTPTRVPTKALTPFASTPFVTWTIPITPAPTMTEYKLYTPGLIIPLTGPYYPVKIF